MKPGHWLVVLTGLLIILGMFWYAEGKKDQFQRDCEAAGNHAEAESGMLKCFSPDGKLVDVRDW